MSMKVGILGSGSVGQSLAKGFIDQGHEVWLATHEPESDKGKGLKDAVPGAMVCDFTTAAKESELAVFCVKWTGAEEVIKLAGAENLADKIVIDTSNILKPEGETMVYGGEGKSAGEQVLGWLPNANVVKAFNTVGADVMYKPKFSTTPTMFIAGDDAEAKKQVGEIATAFGWEPLDAGVLVCSRELEAMAVVWIRYSMAHGRGHAFKML
jgi:predicted dinucleotide-binding enzyme